MFTKPIHTKLLLGFLFIAALFLPLYVPDSYMFQIVITSLLFAIATSSMNLILGYTGQASLAHGAFFGVGAYVVAIMTKAGWSFWIALPVSGLVATGIGFFIGLFAFRTRGHFFAIVTLCFGVILFQVAENWIEVTGGQNGIFGLDSATPIPFPFFGPIEFSSQPAQYYLVLAVLLLTLFVLHRVVYSIFGLTFMAIRNNEELADALGINTFATKMVSFAIANFIAAIAGGIYATILGAVSPSAISIMITFNFLIFLILGGMATLPGAVIGAFMIPIIMEFLQFMENYRMLFFGALLVVVIIWFPMGFFGGLKTINQKIIAWRQSNTSEDSNA
ncbi:MAG: branched-chain amino acid ABC transporter permease [Proteobacteria bacterium]|nr:branched-chain amino acid ABC transporter permease [Pseudomonadota bacterium]MBU1388017.1 branched-chain amino acid ABC transporter permease [Pseudomonadota bacterium]MBU1542080.1 branched-chain amino acid ABC transporter permease [Pseudomonadota bacterium]MBU2430447.1 branched-chain amino acid ABC transporter permease [Pseudomonadota bacterium]MBU2482864.1 branched-chain amino acid ABC transporter permease [Pseudomonadota bacterium]